MDPLKDKIALITGGSRGLGAGFVRLLSNHSMNLVVLGKSEENLENLKKKLGKTKASILYTVLDLSNPELMASFFKSFQQRFERLDLLIGNAAIIGELMPLYQYTPPVWAKILNTNLTANWYLLHLFTPLLKKGLNPRVFFISSSTALHPQPYCAPYGASKAALASMIASYAMEMRSPPILANIIDPGPMRTDMRAQVRPGEDPSFLCTPEEIASKIYPFLLNSFSQTGLTLYLQPGR